MSLDPEAASFKAAMRQFATTVSIVSTAGGGERFGMTATAIASVSMDPPGLLICVNHDAGIHDPLKARRLFWLNVLHEGQEEFCSAFGGGLPADERFSLGNWSTCESGLPYLADAQANILCAIEADLAYGTHTIFVAKVLKALSHSDIRPLVYFKGGFAGIQMRS